MGWAMIQWGEWYTWLWGEKDDWSSQRKLWGHRNHQSPVYYPVSIQSCRPAKTRHASSLTFPGLSDSQPDWRLWPRSEFLFLPDDPALLSSNSPVVQLFLYLHRKGICDSFWKLECCGCQALSWLLAQSPIIHRPGRKPNHVWVVMQQPGSPADWVAALTL